MADADQPQAAVDLPSAPGPTIHEAVRVAGSSGAVEYGAELTLARAVIRRKTGLDIVVRGDNPADNRRVAQQIESGVGGSYLLHPPHACGRKLPHYQQRVPPPDGHSFYELPDRRARRKR